MEKREKNLKKKVPGRWRRWRGFWGPDPVGDALPQGGDPSATRIGGHTMRRTERKNERERERVCAVVAWAWFVW